MDSKYIRQLKDFFKEKNISQLDLANTLKTSQQYVSAILNGKQAIGKSVAKKIEKLYGIQSGWLLTGGEGEMLKDPQTITNNAGRDINHAESGGFNIGNKGTHIGDNNINPNDFKLLIDIINQKNEIVQQKEQYIIQLRKKLEEQHSDFVRRLDEKEGYYSALLAEKDNFVIKTIETRDELMKKMMDREEHIVRNSYLRNQENLERMDRMHEKLFELQSAILKFIENK